MLSRAALRPMRLFAMALLASIAWSDVILILSLMASETGS